ncbi:GNAT family N-acetyltransferase [Marinicrinis lubricantis]|uniref:GNAT family N-acetyltransferase n=1 Tax=Marinicrinis lubricantis TaxID=2086470 RepID=A0ABW1IU97_9BACL
MLIDVKHRLNEPEIRDLLAYAVFPEPEALERAVHSYSESEQLLYAYEEEGRLVGVIGILPEQDGFQITHIAVAPEERRKGIGEEMIVLAAEQRDAIQISAETDDDAVDFYRKVGFIVTSLGETFPGVERYLCTWNRDEDSE